MEFVHSQNRIRWNMEKFVFLHKKGVLYGSFPLLSEAGFVNGCSTRLFGKSAIVEGTFNLALHVGDEPELVLENRRRYAEALGVKPESFTTCAQVHGSQVVKVTQELVGSGALEFANTIKETDSLITDLAGVPLLLFYADCTPVLLADPKTGAIGLAHAGWRGTVAGIAKKTVAAMVQEFGCEPSDILGAIGPAIGACCYEVDDFVRNQAAGYEKFFEPNGKIGKYQLDLWGYNRQQLLEAGLKSEHIAVAEVCTADNSQLICSYRAEKGQTGRMGVCLCRKS